ncbi:MAG: hypothetical protein IPF92_06440 [Myxococcales bacterium]|nr:hypothetical protein [Myxococcales bacterium]MBL0192683.1 hypothetical protein [Myxococcales bacterium]HQY60278.1 hypothetical protein [Polyangiaceae bacterium]
MSLASDSSAAFANTATSSRTPAGSFFQSNAGCDTAPVAQAAAIARRR